jgi:hypothetical protein
MFNRVPGRDASPRRPSHGRKVGGFGETALPAESRIIVILLVFALLSSPAMADIFVSATAPAGCDGTKERPFSTLEQARVAVRTTKSDEPVTVRIAGGNYIMRRGVTFTAGDSGDKDHPITYLVEPGATARFAAGVVVPASALKTVEDEAVLARVSPDVRGRLKAVSLDDLGISATRFADNFKGIELLEIFWNGRRLPLSRWPDDGGFARMKKVTDNGINPPHGGTFVYRGDEPARWLKAMEEGDVWLRGFWRVPWVIEGAKVGAINPDEKTITFAVPISGGIGSKYKRGKDGTGPGSGDEPWQAVNLIEEINQPGEWAVHFPTRTLYLLPPEGEGELLISDVREPVLSFANVSYVTLQGLTVDGGLGEGIRVEGGEEILIAGCRVRNLARAGVTVKGGHHHTVLTCDISETGLEGLDLTGGDRRTLEPGGHRVINNIISHAGIYYPASALQAGIGPQSPTVGNLIAHNRVHDSANTGVQYSGNDNILEYNDIYRIGLGSSDLGCFYTTGGWTSRGNIVRNNFVHHSMNANSFYVDDGDSGDTFLGNVAYKTGSGGFIGGGHDQIFRNNIIIESTRAMHVDSRGVARGYTADDKRLRGDLDSVPYQSPPWSDKYPELVKILDTDPAYPSGIIIEDNLFVRCETAIRKSSKESELTGVTIQNNIESDDLGMFVDPEALNFSLKPDAPVFAAIPGFPNIPFEKIGIYPDAYRPVVPPRDMELLRTGKTERGFDSQTDIDASNRKP